MAKGLEAEFVRLFMKDKGAAWLEEQVVDDAVANPSSSGVPSLVRIVRVGLEQLDWGSIENPGAFDDEASWLFDAALAAIDRTEVKRLLRERFARLAPSARKALQQGFFADEEDEEQEEGSNDE